MSAELNPTSGDCLESPPEPYKLVTLSQPEESGLEHDHRFHAQFTGACWIIKGGDRGWGRFHLPISAMADIEWQYVD